MNEIAELQSPIIYDRKHIQAELDEEEEIVIDAIKEYREHSHVRPFKNNPKYYADAEKHNKEL